MSLPVGERRKLRTIERATARADPALAARFSMFNQISRQEDMPRTERVKARAIRRKKWAERAMNAYLILGPDTLLSLTLSGILAFG
jgi:hypothetical protein